MTTHIENGYIALQSFATHMTKFQQISDGLLTARVIGEFSAGKTRFLRELLGDSIPPALYPVSSLERQTRLPMEITYGPEPELTLVQRANDYEINDKARTLQTLTEFPDREATVQYDPLQHRLRLAIPENRLILNNGDGYSDDKSAKRLFLIDMPGWNSGDDLLAESDASEIMTGFHNLALVYVVSAIRLDSLKNSERLNNFLQAFSDANFVGAPHLIVIMTHCPAAEANALQQKVKKQVNAMWNELGEASSLSMDLLSIDFEEVNPTELVAFRDKFWQSLLFPLGHSVAVSVQHPWIHGLHSWPKHWLLEEPIAQTHALLVQARAVVQAASQEESYLAGMNMTKLGGLNVSDVRKRLKEAWNRQMRNAAIELDKPLHQNLPVLDEKHPLAAWWKMYWIPHLQLALQPIEEFLNYVSSTINKLPINTPDLHKHLRQSLDSSYFRALQSTDSSFTLIVDVLERLPKTTPPEETLATLLKLSLLQMRYQDHLENKG